MRDKHLAKAIARNVKDFRTHFGLSQTELATIMKVNQAAVSHIECGKRTPSAETLVKLSDALGFSVDAILGRAS